jgi:hypothetical protein
VISPARAAFVASVFLFLFARAASAQAFVPASGEGNVTLAYQNLLADGHLDLNGDRMIGPSGADRVYSHAVVCEVEFGVTDRWALHAALPYIRSRYVGTAPHRPGGAGPPREWDDGTFHGAFQDFRIGARYNIRTHPIAITPFGEVIIPSHHYQSIAHAAVGKDLRALVIGLSAGGFLDAVLPRMFFQTQVSYALVQEVLDVRPNRTRVEGEVGYFLTPRLPIRFLMSYQVTHQGVDVKGFLPMTDGHIHDHPEIPFTGEFRASHDRLLRTNYLTFGGGGSVALNDSVDVFINILTTAWGENVHPLRAVTVGINTNFRLRGAP